MLGSLLKQLMLTGGPFPPNHSAPPVALSSASSVTPCRGSFELCITIRPFRIKSAPTLLALTDGRNRLHYALRAYIYLTQKH